MSEYDSLLTNISQMLKYADEQINECRTQNAVHIDTHLNDALLNFDKVKGELDKFETLFDADTRFRLINQPYWTLKTDKEYLFKVRELDLRTMDIMYSYNSMGTTYYRRDAIATFLNNFE